jgi:pyruvate/2-oxoglutarate dehydrogenase complex dihydrolipoamide dehydrogenase (E3) component
VDERLSLTPADVYNQALAASVRPAEWLNPVPAPRYNLVVIGAGTAGLVSAAGAAALGAKVALVERRLMGGDCLNFGCVPSKALLRSARAAADVRSAGRFGVDVPAGVGVDFARVMERVRRLRSEIGPHDSAERFRNLGVDVFFGQARFFGANRLDVDGKTLNFHRVILATGTRPAVPAIPGLAEAGFLTNETVFSLTDLPRRLAVIGAGPIGCELAQAFARLGSQVTLIGNRGEILPREEPDAAHLVAEQLRRDGVELLLNSEIVEVRRQGHERIVGLMQRRERQEMAVDAILIAIGRTPVVDGLDLEAAGVAFDPKVGVTVDDRLQTSNARIFAAGDICSRFKFTHAADALARIALQNALFFRRQRASALTIPWCTYTDPEIARVGLSEAEARERSIPVQTFEQQLDGVDRAVLDGETEGFGRILVRAGTDRIVGATIVARHAGDMIAEVTLAMTARLGLRTLSATIHPYPTQAEVLKKLGDACNRTRLTPTVQWLFGKWLGWTR